MFGGNCEICNDYSFTLKEFTLTSYEKENNMITSNNYHSNVKHRSIHVCDRCYQELYNLRYCKTLKLSNLSNF